MLSAKLNGGNILNVHINPTPTSLVEGNNLRKNTVIARNVPSIMWMRLDVTAPADYESGKTDKKYEKAIVGNG